MKGLVHSHKRPFLPFPDNFPQSFLLLLAVSQDVAVIASHAEVVERLLHEVEILVEQRLRRDAEMQYGVCRAYRPVTELHGAEVKQPSSELSSADELRLTLQLVHYLLALHFRHVLQLHCHGLLRKAFLIYGSHTILHKLHVLHGNHRPLRQEVQHRHLVLRRLAQFRHYFHLLPSVSRKLCIDLKGTYGVNVVSKEVDAERIFT